MIHTNYRQEETRIAKERGYPMNTLNKGIRDCRILQKEFIRLFEHGKPMTISDIINASYEKKHYLKKQSILNKTYALHKKGQIIRVDQGVYKIANA